MGDHQLINLATDDGIEQSLEALCVRVHAGLYPRDGVKRPALAGTEQLKHQFLSFQLVPLIVSGNTGIGQWFAGWLRLRHGIALAAIA
ncbi:hypothetical protein A7K73_05870 [Candidatus Methylacidiphilum fumarolicum]|uniref:Uncharacterized protein n=1 Tax=Candidatus Methylacidiphilum fumarolicum TaxID=591154 RepID=A0ABM9ICR4_9BACT|nr:hypothetical protein A7K73_05870 [Candidatus Methylacidiphilum fumarolicum]TFE77156.1 hypothetical protein A7D33_06205 [Candidatus Methylacidiphilum fumarolicum]CAI9085440.1 protein of unknown function [Candidatus Methylacidiphilum fumarolicum]